MANGETVTVNASDVTVNGSGIIATDIKARNGVVHLIDTVLLPPSVTSSLTTGLAAPAYNASPIDSDTEATSWGSLKSTYR
jgi:transforming growth factor-beta-induced protein